MRKLIFSILFLSVLNVFGQIPRKCAIAEVASEKLKRRHELLNSKLQEYYLKTAFSYSDNLIRIPVVVHVIHNNASGKIGGPENGNISNEQIYSQIKVLNEDYRRKFGTRGYNTSSVGADMNIEFFLANYDPKGNPSDGIVRIYSSKPKFDVFRDDLTLSNLSYWDSNRYLNIWVTSLDDDFLGYGEFPTGEFDGLDLEEIDERIDGVMIDHHAFGNKIGTSIEGVYTYGRTLTHEIGHWLGLIHTWGDEYCGDDFCADTPPTESGNLTIKCTQTYSNCRNQKTLNMIENFMDYSPDSCMNIFTQEQKNRTRAILEISKRRKRLITNAEFNLPQVDNLTVRVLENPTSGENIFIQILMNDFSNFSYEIFDNSGKKILSQSFEDTPSRLIQIPRISLGKGVFNLRVSSGEINVMKRLISP